MKLRSFLLIAFAPLFFYSCVSSKKFKTAQADIAKLQDRYKTLEEVHAFLRLLAAELGPEAVARAEQVAASDLARLAALRARLAGVAAVRVIAPSTYGVIAGADTTFQDLCDHAGAENLAFTLGGLRGHAAPPTERLLGWPVERVVLSGEGDVGAALARYRTVPPYAFMPAVREGRAVCAGACRWG